MKRRRRRRWRIRQSWLTKVKRLQNRRNRR
nr:MAG TPA: REV protein [Caudoviricetes sp.]